MPYDTGMGHQRSPRYPAVSLSDAIQAVRSLWGKEKRTAVQAEVLAKALGYSSLSGGARTKIASMRQYGLLEKHAGGLRLSDLGMKIIHNQEGSEEQSKALREAAVSPELFKELYESHADGSEDAIKSFLILKKGFSDSGARLAAAAYRDTLSLAKPNSQGYTDGNDDANDPDETVRASTEPQTLGRQLMKEMDKGASVGEALVKTGQKFGAPLLTQTLVISIPRHFSVDFSVRGDEIKKEDLAKIKSQFNRWIEGLEEAFEE